MELKSGEIYRGELHDAEDNWNVQLTNVQATARDGKVRRCPAVCCPHCLPELASSLVCMPMRSSGCIPQAAAAVTGCPDHHTDSRQRALPCACSPCRTCMPYPSCHLLHPPSCRQVSHMEHIFIRGSRVRYVIVPDMLKNAPMVRGGRHGGGEGRVSLEGSTARCGGCCLRLHAG